jgi:hypothetical protein
MAVRLSALRAAALYPPGRFLVLISGRSWVDPRATVRIVKRNCVLVQFILRKTGTSNGEFCWFYMDHKHTSMNVHAHFVTLQTSEQIIKLAASCRQFEDWVSERESQPQWNDEVVISRKHINSVWWQNHRAHSKFLRDTSLLWSEEIMCRKTVKQT